MSITVNGRAMDVEGGTTVAGLVSLLGARPTGTAVAVNGDVVPRSAWASQLVLDGDTLEVLAAVQGG